MARSSTTFTKGPNARRHVFTKEQRQKGYQAFLTRVEAGTLSSRVRASVRSKIRRTGKGKAAAGLTNEAADAHQAIYDDSIPF